ncbi:MAG TPA: branched-chain amino acid ABC transporter permease [Ktedonobacterales bacterium]
MHTMALAAAGPAGFLNFLQAIKIGITAGAIYALVALGYTLVYGIIELINFAHGDVFMWGTQVTFVLITALGITSTIGGWQLVGVLALLVVAASVFCGVLNVTIERLAYRPLRRAPRLAPLIAAIAVSFILENIAELWRGPGQIAFPNLFPSTALININQTFVVEYRDVFIVVLALVIMFALSRFILGTKLGRAMRATAQDPEAAQLMGVNINTTIALTFLLGGALAGAGAVVFTVSTAGYVWFFTGFQFGLYAFTAAVLGGIGNVNGAVLGGFMIGIVEGLSIAYLPQGSILSTAVVFGVLVLVLVFRPTGFLGAQVPDKA